jgi:hypothetical protein
MDGSQIYEIYGAKINIPYVYVYIRIRRIYAVYGQPTLVIMHAINQSIICITNLRFRIQVSFALHASFAIPNRELTAPPYEVHEQGWGEFDVQIKVLSTMHACLLACMHAY